MLLRNLRGNIVAVPASRRSAQEIPFSNTNPLRFRLLDSMATSGVAVGPDEAFSLPTVIECVRQPAQLIASLDWGVWDWTQPSVPALSQNAWQSGLLEDPVYSTKFELFQDISTSIDGWGGAYVQKIKGTGKMRKQVVALKVIDPDQVRVVVKDGVRKFEVKIYDKAGGRTTETRLMDSSEILYVRGFAHRGFLAGLVPFEIFRNSVGNILAVEQFSANWWRNSGTTSQVITHPDRLNSSQAQQILDIFDETHTGLDNAGKPALLSGGAKLETVNITAEDAQLLGSREWGVEETARAMNWNHELLTSDADKAKTEETMLRTKIIYLNPRARRIRDAFNADPDLFQGFNTAWLDYKLDSLEAADAMTQATANLRNRQAGIVTANELRQPMGLGPHPDGDALQLTPVGGAPNPGAAEQPNDGE